MMTSVLDDHFIIRYASEFAKALYMRRRKRLFCYVDVRKSTKTRIFKTNRRGNVYISKYPIYFLNNFDLIFLSFRYMKKKTTIKNERTKRKKKSP